MNIPTGKIENNEFYIEVAFKRANESAKLTRLKVGGSRIQKSQMIEAAKLDSVNDVLSNFLEKIQMAFPNYRELTTFYQELIKCYFDVGDFRKSLAAMIWAKEKIAEFCKFYKHKILKCTQLPKINQFRTQFYGRVSSTMKQINKNLQLLEEARKILNDFPVVKMMKTVCIAGFPNVGKTTLLSKLTKSKPEIASYSFTTKRLNMGYSDDIQFIDTPGTLNRLEKMNAIERQALMAMKYVADKIIYVFDLTEIYPIEDQIKLLDVVKELKKPIIIYLSKTDILDDYMEFAKKYNAVTDIEELKRKI
jgi:nucleolar GTP-binding protein